MITRPREGDIFLQQRFQGPHRTSNDVNGSKQEKTKHNIITMTASTKERQTTHLTPLTPGTVERKYSVVSETAGESERLGAHTVYATS